MRVKVLSSATENTEDTEKNLVMVLTPAGEGAIAVVRLRGAVDSFLEKHFSKEVVEGRCVYGEVRDGEKVIDDAVAVRGADFVDLNVHGGSWVVRSVLELAKRSGFEVTESALEMMDGQTILEKEVMAALPRAGTELALRVLLEQVGAWERPGDAGEILGDRSLWWLLHPPRVAIVGVANVGKSTLANQLFGQERSITADVPGTTRDWVGEMANIDGLMLMLVDTPGIRKSGDVIEERAIEGSREQIAGADLVVVVVDQTQAAAGQVELMRQYKEAVIVANKVDRAGEWEVGRDVIKTVATTGVGVDTLRRAIRRRFGCEEIELKRARWWTERQREILAGVASGKRSLNEIGAGVVKG
jgi:small GTP-binding protein